MRMTISKEELQAYNEAKGNGTATKPMIDWVQDYRQNNGNKEVVADIEVKSEREEVMEILDSMGVEYKKNASTESLKKLLAEKA